MSITLKYKKKIQCPICKHPNMYYVWFEKDLEKEPDYGENDIYYFGEHHTHYFCHSCGFFETSTDDGCEGRIVIHPKVIPLEKQLKILKKHHKKLNGLKIGIYDNSDIKRLKKDLAPWNYC